LKIVWYIAFYIPERLWGYWYPAKAL